MRHEEQVFLEFRQLAGAKKRLVAHQQRRIDLHVPVFTGVQVEHELAKRAFKARQCTLDHGEARAGEFCRCLEIHQAERLAQLIMLLRLEIIGRQPANLAHLHVGAFVRSDRHVFERDIGHTGQCVAQARFQITLGSFAGLERVLDRGHFGFQFLGGLGILAAHGHADFL